MDGIYERFEYIDLRRLFRHRPRYKIINHDLLDHLDSRL